MADTTIVSRGGGAAEGRPPSGPPRLGRTLSGQVWVFQPSRETLRPASAQATSKFPPGVQSDPASPSQGARPEGAGTQATVAERGTGGPDACTQMGGARGRGSGGVASLPQTLHGDFSQATASLNPAGAPGSLGEEAGAGRAGTNGHGPLYPSAPPSDFICLQVPRLSPRLRGSPRSWPRPGRWGCSGRARWRRWGGP